MLRVSLLVLSILSSSAFVQAQTSTYTEGSSKKDISWDEFIGKIVTVEGLAWGGYAKGPYAQHLVLTDGKVSLQGVNFFRDDLDGRLLRVSGVLQKRGVHHPDTKELLFEFHYIETLALERIDQVKLNQLFPSKCDWLLGGMDLEAALTLVAKHRGQAYDLELAPASPGEKIYVFQFPMGETVSLHTVKDRVISLNKIELGGAASKRDVQIVPLAAFELKPLRVIE